MAVKTGRIRRAFTFTRSDLRSYAMLAPYLFFYALTILVPLVITVALSFTTYNMFQMPKWAGLDNFIRIFIADDVFLKAFTNTILFAVFTGPLSFLLCFFVAWVINDLPPKLRALVTLVFYAPSISGTAYVMWSFIFSPDANGIANGWLMGLGILDEPLLWFQDTKMTSGC